MTLHRISVAGVLAGALMLNGCAGLGTRGLYTRATASFGQPSLIAPTLASAQTSDGQTLSMMLQGAEVNLQGPTLIDSKAFDIGVPLTINGGGVLTIQLEVRGSAITSSSGVVELWTLQPRPKLVRRWSGGQEGEFYATTSITLDIPAQEVQPGETIQRTGRIAVLLRATRPDEAHAAMIALGSIDARIFGRLPAAPR